VNRRCAITAKPLWRNDGAFPPVLFPIFAIFVLFFRQFHFVVVAASFSPALNP